MKTTKILVNGHWLLVMGMLWILGIGQVGAVTYKGSYQPSGVSRQSSVVSRQTTAPVATFQSTSAYATPEWEEQPMLNADGSVNEGAYMGGRNNAPGPRRSEEREGGTGTPGGEGGEHIKQPLGDAVLPLMLLAIAYCGWRFLRRRKEA